VVQLINEQLVSYLNMMAQINNAIKSWKKTVEHSFGQKLGKERWCKWFKVRVAKVERDYEFKN